MTMDTSWDAAEDALAHLLRLAAQGDPGLSVLQGFQPDGRLGAGGMGAVFCVRKPESAERLAVKLILPRLAARPAAHTLFSREINNMQALQHPNIVQAYGAGNAGSAVFIVMEYCEGGSLGDLIARSVGGVPLSQALDITRQLLDALEYLHIARIENVALPGGVRTARGLVHRDIKPQNVFLTGNDRAIAKLGDYGLSKAFEFAGLSRITLPSSVGGTYAFMPRTQLADYLHAGPEVDLWAVAATLYAMLTGTAPRDFAAGHARGLSPAMVVEQTKPVPIRERVPSVPAQVARLIDNALDDDDELLFQHAADFLRELLAVSAR